MEQNLFSNFRFHCSTWNILRYILGFSLLVQAILIIIQFLKQESIGFFYLGESILSPAIAGVATIIVNNTEILRGYGTFLHPNIAAFFFFVYGIAYILLFIVPRGTIPNINSINCSTWNTPLLTKLLNVFHVEHSSQQKLAKAVPRGTIIFVLGMILLGFTLTFSKSVIVLVIIICFSSYFLLNCSTWNIMHSKRWYKMFHVEHLRKRRPNIVPRGTMTAGVIIVGIFLGKYGGIPDFIEQSILERKLQYLSIPVSSPSEFLIGEGLGNYTKLLAEKSPGLYLWQLQPIHNIYILAIIEIGLLPILGISLYMWLKWRKYPHKSPSQLFWHQKVVFVISGGVVLLLSIDHYMWDIEQGQFLFMILIATLAFAYNYALPKNRE